MKIAVPPVIILVFLSLATRVVSAFHHGGNAPTSRVINSAVLGGSSPIHVPPTTKIQTTSVSRISARSTSGSASARVAKITSSTSLQMAAADEKVTDRIVFGHRLCSFLFFIVAAGIIYNSIGGPVGWGLPLYAASGPYLAAGVSSILSDAASAGRLSSATYKRLALFQTEFNLCGVSTILLALGGTAFREQLFYGLSLASFLSLSPTLAGYKKGEPDFFGEAGNLIKGFFSFKNFNSFIYLCGTWFVASLKVLKLVDMINLIMEGNPAKTIVTRAVRFGRLALLTGVMYTLKDAANRDRLQGTTFIDLNVLASIVFGTMAYYVKTIRGAMTPLVWTSAGFSAFTVLNGLVSAVNKSKK